MQGVTITITHGDESATYALGEKDAATLRECLMRGVNCWTGQTKPERQVILELINELEDV